jgi:ketosteroid isomerase-like protein
LKKSKTNAKAGVFCILKFLMKNFFLLLTILFSLSVAAQSKNEETIRNLLEEQTIAWNRGDIDGFMQGYWESDSLMFIGKNGVVWGWQNTLNNYKKGYPDTAAMGKLAFDLIQIKKLSRKYYFVVGKWMLQRNAGDLSGHYNLLLRKIRGQWKIVADHSS